MLLFHGNNDFVNAPQCQVIRTLPVLLYIYNFGESQYVKVIVVKDGANHRGCHLMTTTLCAGCYMVCVLARLGRDQQLLHFCLASDSPGDAYHEGEGLWGYCRYKYFGEELCGSYKQCQVS